MVSQVANPGPSSLSAVFYVKSTNLVKKWDQMDLFVNACIPLWDTATVCGCGCFSITNYYLLTLVRALD